MARIETRHWVHDRLRLAHSSDVTAIELLVHSAYAKYVPRIGRKPKPMLSNYARAVESHQFWVVVEGESLIALLELIPNADFLLIENIAVQPEFQQSGLGRALMAYAQDEAMRMGLHELRLYTNERFTENIRFYTSIGYKETHRELYLGADVVHMAKQLKL